jgi:hypothetical protein
MSLFEVSKHIVGVVFHDHVLHVYAIIVHQLWHFGVQRYYSRSCILFSHIVEVDFIQSFIVAGLLFLFLVLFNQMFRGAAFSSKVVSTTTFMACKCLVFAFAFALTIGYVLHVLVVVFAFLEFTKFL